MGSLAAATLYRLAVHLSRSRRLQRNGSRQPRSERGTPDCEQRPRQLRGAAVSRTHLRGIRFIPSISARYQREWGNGTQLISSSFAGAPTVGFATAGNNLGRDFGLFSLGTTAMLSEGAAASTPRSTRRFQPTTPPSWAPAASNTAGKRRWSQASIALRDPSSAAIESRACFERRSWYFYSLRTPPEAIRGGNRAGFMPVRSTSKIRRNLLPCKGFGRVAQLVEQRTENPCVVGSIPTPTTSQPLSDNNLGSGKFRVNRGGEWSTRAHRTPLDSAGFRGVFSLLVRALHCTPIAFDQHFD